jgi:hypothetical protein
MEEPVATLESGQPDYERVESITANIEEQLKELGGGDQSKQVARKVKKKGSSLASKRRQRSSNRGAELGLKTPDSESSERSNTLDTFGKRKMTGEKSVDLKVQETPMNA